MLRVRERWQQDVVGIAVEHPRVGVDLVEYQDQAELPVEPYAAPAQGERREVDVRAVDAHSGIDELAIPGGLLPLAAYCGPLVQVEVTAVRQHAEQGVGADVDNDD